MNTSAGDPLSRLGDAGIKFKAHEEDGALVITHRVGWGIYNTYSRKGKNRNQFLFKAVVSIASSV